LLIELNHHGEKMARDFRRQAERDGDLLTPELRFGNSGPWPDGGVEKYSNSSVTTRALEADDLDRGSKRRMTGVRHGSKEEPAASGQLDRV
jgi:hypothetical protein